MNLEFRRFQRQFYCEYASWFTDPELNRWLGPMAPDWLEATLSKPESAGITWAVFRDAELVAVVETVFDPQHQSPAAITAVATKPALRWHGIGTAVLQHILSLHKRQRIDQHIAYVSVDNPAGQRLAAKVGFVPVTSEPSEHGYIKLGHRQALAPRE